jgi:hypothetical protein
MKTKRNNLIKGTILAALLLVGGGVQASARRITRIHGRIESIDRTNMTLTVKETGRKEPLTVYITSQTRLFKDAEPAITSDLAVGERIHGSARKDAAGELDALRLYTR